MTDTKQDKKTALVVSAHSADFVWRAGGAVAKYAKRGWRVVVVCLSYGERGESAKLWRQGDMTLDKVKADRHREAEAAAKLLGAELTCLDIGDYPMRVTDKTLYRLVDIYRELRPSFVLTHALADPHNFDHPLAAHLAMEARIVAQAHGHNPETAPIGAPPVFLFEPHQTEMCEFKPQVYLPIDDVWDLKRKAFECMGAQEYLWEYYTRVALQRGVQATRNSERKVVHAEAYQRVYPQITDDLA